MKFRSNKVLSIVILVIFFAGLFASFLHFHAGDEPQHDCGACRLVQALCIAFVGIFLTLIKPLSQKYFASPLQFYFPSFQLSTSSNRAPPRI